MRDSTLNDKAIIEARTDKYALIPRQGMDYFAQIIEDYHGFVTGFNGNNNIIKNPILEIPTRVDWGHAVYCCGYKLINGKKCLIFKNSWKGWGDNGYGYITEDFENSGYLFDAYVYAAFEDIDPNTINLQFKFGRDLFYGDTSEDVRQLQKRLGVKQTGYYGNLTKEAVWKFQKASGLGNFWEFLYWRGKRVDLSTRIILNK